MYILYLHDLECKSQRLLVMRCPPSVNSIISRSTVVFAFTSSDAGGANAWPTTKPGNQRHRLPHKSRIKIGSTTQCNHFPKTEKNKRRHAPKSATIIYGSCYITDNKDME